MCHSPHLKIHRLDAAEGSFHEREGFIATYCRRVVEGLGRQAGAHDIKPVSRRLGGDLIRLSREAEGGIGDLQIEMLGHLALVDHRADRERDFGGAAQRVALAGDGGLDASEVALGGGEQILALAGALSGEIGIATDDQALAGEVGRGDAGHVALVEQRELDRATA